MSAMSKTRRAAGSVASTKTSQWDMEYIERQGWTPFDAACVWLYRERNIQAMRERNAKKRKASTSDQGAQATLECYMKL